jgi:hypothetical protein
LEQITKLDAALRNLRAAVRLFFERGDPVAVHTLAAAAQGIIRDIARARGMQNTSILHDNPGIPAEDRKRWITDINAARNFFKHADTDPDGILEFDERENVRVLLDAVAVLGQFDGVEAPEANVFMGWFTTAHPGMRSAVTGNVIGDYAVRNSISPDDYGRFRELCDARILIDEA